MLSPFDEHVDVDALVARAADAAEAIVREGLEPAQQHFNERPVTDTSGIWTSFVPGQPNLRASWEK